MGVVRGERKGLAQNAASEESIMAKDKKTGVAKGGVGKGAAPKRGMSSFMWFCKAKRAELKKERPELTFGEMGKVLGEMWKDLPEAKKAPYVKQAEDDKKRYMKEKAAYGS